MQKMREEQQKLYAEAGVNPVAGCFSARFFSSRSRWILNGLLITSVWTTEKAFVITQYNERAAGTFNAVKKMISGIP